MQIARPTVYELIAGALRQAILAGEYEPTPEDPTRNELPGAAELGAKYGVSDKTAARAVQQLVTEGLVRARRGQRPVAVALSERPRRWPMHRRYARAREADSLVFGDDMPSGQVVKEVRSTGWTPAPEPIAALLQVDPGDRVWRRARRTRVEGRIVGLSVSYFPASIAEGTSLMSPGQFPPGGVVRALEEAGHQIIRTYNEVRARLATAEELEAFGSDPALSALDGRIVLEITHVTYGANDQPLEAVVSIRPAHDNVVVFQTYEGPDEHPEHDPSIASSDPR